jgi:hypothetical protein
MPIRTGEGSARVTFFQTEVGWSPTALPARRTAEKAAGGQVFTLGALLEGLTVTLAHRAPTSKDAPSRGYGEGGEWSRFPTGAEGACGLGRLPQ